MIHQIACGGDKCSDYATRFFSRNRMCIFVKLVNLTIGFSGKKQGERCRVSVFSLYSCEYRKRSAMTGFNIHRFSIPGPRTSHIVAALIG